MVANTHERPSAAPNTSTASDDGAVSSGLLPLAMRMVCTTRGFTRLYLGGNNGGGGGAKELHRSPQCGAEPEWWQMAVLPLLWRLISACPGERGSENTSEFARQAWQAEVCAHHSLDPDRWCRSSDGPLVATPCRLKVLHPRVDVLQLHYHERPPVAHGHQQWCGGS